jgi:hypothetical protein
MSEPALLDLTRELDVSPRKREPELDVDIELDDDDALLDPWFLRSEEEIAQIEDDPSAQIHEIQISALDERWT